MKCSSPEILHRYRRGTLPSLDAAQEIEKHLAECAACRQLLHAEIERAGPRLASALLPAPEDMACPEDAAFVRYVDGTAEATERELLKEHLQDCARCREDVDDLRAFREEMRDYDWKKTRAATWRERFQDGWYIAAGQCWDFARGLVVRWQKRLLWTRLLAALLLGLLAGWAMGPKAVIFRPVSAGVVHLIGAVATPLIFFAILHTLLQSRTSGRVFVRLGLFLLTNSLIAALIGLFLIDVLHPGTGGILNDVPPVQEVLPPVPVSLLAPLAENNLLYVILLALGLSLTLREVRQEERQGGTAAYRAVEDIIGTAYRCLMKLLQWVLALTPLAVFASAAYVVGTYGRRPFQSLGGFALLVLFGLVLQCSWYLLRLRMGSHVRPIRAVRETRSALLMAFSTASSAATMPFAYARVKERLRVREESASLGILVGGNVNRDGTALFEAMGVLFIAQAMGIPLGFAQQALVIVMAVAASVCAPGIPEAGLVTMVLVFQALHLPQAATYIVLLLPLDWLLDRCRTMVNVLGHITVACLLDGKSIEPRFRTEEKARH